MRTILTPILAGLVIAAVSCSGPEVRILSKPQEGSPSAVREELRQPSEEVLRREGLWSAYRQDPDGALRTLYERYQRDGGPERLKAVAELCGSLGVKRESDPLAAAGYYLDAARLAREGARGAGWEKSPDLRLIYNVSCSSLASLLHRAGLLGSSPREIGGPLRSYRFSLGAPGKAGIDPAYYDELVPADRIMLANIVLTRERQEGLGGAMVAHRRRRGSGEVDDPFISPAGYGLPVNAMLEFPGSAGARLVLRDLMKVDHVRVAGREVPLAADWSASLGYLFRYAPPSDTGFMGLLRPGEYSAATNLYEIHPFDPAKIPVVLVHGLMSSPETWVEMLNVLRGDSVLREHYHWICFRYPTGYPISRNAASLRKALQDYRATYETPQSRSRMRRMVLVGHSLGGILSNLQIRHSGEEIRKMLFDKPIDELEELSEESRATLKRTYVFEPDPAVERAIFIAAPHRGSDFATNPIGRLGANLISLPRNFLGAGIGTDRILELPELTDLARYELDQKPTSVRDLQPDFPLLEATLKLPVGKRITYHSIIGRHDPSDPIPESTDTIVPYWSSHLDGAASEKVVHAKHTTITHNRDAIEEVRRILYLHLGRKAPQPMPVSAPTP